MDGAACAQVDSELFFPSAGQDARVARRVCASCAVAAECLEYALAQDPVPDGVWGGFTEKERRQMRRKVAA